MHDQLQSDDSLVLVFQGDGDPSSEIVDAVIRLTKRADPNAEVETILPGTILVETHHPDGVRHALASSKAWQSKQARHHTHPKRVGHRSDRHRH
jgi:hypothetical protein